MGKKAAIHIREVVRGMLFIGFTVQILLGLAWMCANFPEVQDFGEPESAFYRGIFRLCGRHPQILYVLQLGAAYGAGGYFLKSFSRKEELGKRDAGVRFREVWRSLALLTYPFAMQCHLAIAPFSFMGSLFLLLLSFLFRAFLPMSGKSGKGRHTSTRRAAFCGLALGCTFLFTLLSGALDMANREKPGHSFAASMASRFAWPTIWYDQENWTEGLREAVGDVLWEASFYPGNMELLETALEEQADQETAKEYYRQIAEVGWHNHASMVLRQMGWDVLGYTVTPVILRLQLKGEAYDSYSGRNYEIMRENAPILTQNYVDYACWWFAAAFLLALLNALAGRISDGKRGRRPVGIPILLCLLCGGILTAVLTMRGAGLMDYKYTVAVSQLWLIPALFSTGDRDSGSPGKTEPIRQ